MRISRLVVKNFRSLRRADMRLEDGLCCIIGENNTGKSALMRALQLCLDNSLPSSYRSLQREDIYAKLDISKPRQVLIGVEFEDFEGNVNEESLVATWKIAPNRARLFYRFRPRLSVREKLSSGAIKSGELTLSDYTWEIRGGGDPAIDLMKIKWDDDGIGEIVRFPDLQSFLVLSLSALRDVEADLRNTRSSPLIRFIESCNIDDAEQQALIKILDDANKAIESSPTIAAIASSVDQAFKRVSGPAFEMDSTLGLSASSFQSILRNIKILLSDHGLKTFEPSRNGLGMNNVLYIAIILEAMKRRIANASSSGQVILIEEPEAHLHPQLQISLLNALSEYGTQVILTTHSTHITSQASFSSLVSLTRKHDDTISCANLLGSVRI